MNKIVEQKTNQNWEWRGFSTEQISTKLKVTVKRSGFEFYATGQFITCVWCVYLCVRCDAMQLQLIC